MFYLLKGVGHNFWRYFYTLVSQSINSNKSYNNNLQKLLIRELWVCKSSIYQKNQNIQRNLRISYDFPTEVCQLEKRCHRFSVYDFSTEVCQLEERCHIFSVYDFYNFLRFEFENNINYHIVGLYVFCPSSLYNFILNLYGQQYKSEILNPKRDFMKTDCIWQSIWLVILPPWSCPYLLRFPWEQQINSSYGIVKKMSIIRYNLRKDMWSVFLTKRKI